MKISRIILFASLTIWQNTHSFFSSYRSKPRTIEDKKPANQTAQPAQAPYIDQKGLEELARILGEQHHQAPPGGNTNVNNNTWYNPTNLNINFTIFGVNPFDGDMYKNWFDNYKSKAQTSAQTCYQWICEHKKRTALYTALGIYALINARLKYLEYCLLKDNNWSFWQPSFTLEQLYAMRQSELAHLMYLDIQRLYTRVNNPIDFATPLISFLYDADRELKYLSEYLWLIKSIRAWHLGSFCLISQHLETNIIVRQQRLLFMKNSFLGWLADYKLNQAQKVEFAKRYRPFHLDA